jgi:hypothetical protein
LGEGFRVRVKTDGVAGVSSVFIKTVRSVEEIRMLAFNSWTVWSNDHRNVLIFEFVREL